jgi:hypothetical protein
MRTTLPGQLPGATAETLEMLMEYISTFGLMTTSGQPKAGWQEWNRQVRQYYATVP